MFKANLIYSNRIKGVWLPAPTERTSLSMTQAHIFNFTVHVNQIVSRDMNFMELSKDSGGGKICSI